MNLLALPATGLRIVQPSNYTHYPVAATQNRHKVVAKGKFTLVLN